ncbi:MAG: hypothetical protein LBL06_01615 [Treponema sp.]|jgi:hypothetical protein|nr:hypothetical protein [Treponema sp.]
MNRNVILSVLKASVVQYAVFLFLFCFVGWSPQFGTIFTYWLASLYFIDGKYWLFPAVILFLNVSRHFIYAIDKDKLASLLESGKS